MEIHPDVFAAHAQFGGDLESMHKCYLFPDLISALKVTRLLVSEAAMTGFNCHDGDWAQRLFANQGVISAALRKAGAA